MNGMTTVGVLSRVTSRLLAGMQIQVYRKPFGTKVLCREKLELLQFQWCEWWQLRDFRVFGHLWEPSVQGLDKIGNWSPCHIGAWPSLNLANQSRYGSGSERFPGSLFSACTSFTAVCDFQIYNTHTHTCSHWKNDQVPFDIWNVPETKWYDRGSHHINTSTIGNVNSMVLSYDVWWHL